MEKFLPEMGLKIMELVTQIAVAREGNEAAARLLTPSKNIEPVDKLVRTLFRTMCELLPSDNTE